MYTKKIQVTRILYHAIENTVASIINAKYAQTWMVLKCLSNVHPVDSVFKPFQIFLLITIHDQVTNNSFWPQNWSRVKNLALTWPKRLKQQLKETGANLNARWEGWVWYSWIAMIDGKVRWNSDEYTTAFLHFNWHGINIYIYYFVCLFFFFYCSSDFFS